MGEARVCSRHQRYCQDGECPYCERPADARIALPPVEGKSSDTFFDWRQIPKRSPKDIEIDFAALRVFVNAADKESIDPRCPQYRFASPLTSYVAHFAYPLPRMGHVIHTTMLRAEDCVQCALQRVSNLRSALSGVLSLHHSRRAEHLNSATEAQADIRLLEDAMRLIYEDSSRWRWPR